MKKRIRVLPIIVVLVLIVLFIGTSSFIGLQVFAGSTQLVTNDETMEVSDDFWGEYGINYESFNNAYKMEEIEISSSYEEHTIPADYIYTVESHNSKDYQTVILVHGLGGNRYSNYPIAEFFLKKGYNVITYDQRSSNENTAKYTTFGYKEKYDLIDWINYIEEQAPGQKIGIWGASFGGATAGLALGYEDIDERVDFLILDCPVSSMEWMVEQEIKSMDIGILAGYMTWCGNIINKIKLGFTYQDTDVANTMKDVKTPVLIINSKLDSLTPYFMGKDIYDAMIENDREIWTVDDSKHCEIWIDHNQEYHNKMENFMRKYE